MRELEINTKYVRRGEDNIFVRVATTANVTLSGEQTIDGVACVEGDYVLVWQQSTAAKNGVYEVRGSNWRALGQIGLVAITYGSQYKEKLFILKTINTYKPTGGSGVTVVARAATANVTTNGSQTVDGGTPSNGDYVLLKSQTTAADRGVWQVNTAGAWTFIGQDTFCVVVGGVANGRTAFFLSASNTYTGLGAFWI